MMNYKKLMFILMMLYISNCSAAIYMQIDKNGNITYSDTPLKNSKLVELPAVDSNVQTVQTRTVEETPTSPASNAQTIEPTYTQFAIQSPANQATIQNQPTIPVDIALQPKLLTGDKIQLLVDGKLTGEAVASTHLELGLIERGTHQLSAIIINSNQQVIQQTNAITIFVHRANNNSSPALNKGVS